MDKWEEFQKELNAQIAEINEGSPVEIELKSLSVNELMLNNKHNLRRVRLDYDPKAGLLWIETSRRDPVQLSPPWDALAATVLMRITGNR